MKLEKKERERAHGHFSSLPIEGVQGTTQAGGSNQSLAISQQQGNTSK